MRHPNGLVRSVSGDYFRTMAIPLVSGRVFTDSDNRQTKQVVIVNRTLVRQFWPAGDPLGARLVLRLEHHAHCRNCGSGGRY